MAGAIIGALVGKVLPDWLLVISLVILLAYTTYTTLLKAKSQYNKENVAIEKARKSVLLKSVDEEIEMLEQTGLLAEQEDDSEEIREDVTEVNSSNAVTVVDELLQLIEMEKNTPTDKVIILSVMVAVVVGLNMLKGGQTSPLGIKCGSPSYW
eukprot:CAMPEP_0119041256 /NCGR_PEP_ID=MMETSP1177-20130426/11453_2 /TAXON_ID=2985 /ORGANISM="Ochromonas sp, Strain CCMP1899" /LENGTH=152 /DNA_ID=CAMNT_0007007145 /DNA_START=655 /DNA_END=1110 /DNA_ORIENTATION=-